MLRPVFITILAAFLLSGGADAAKYPMTVKDCRGRSILIPREPQRIVSLAPGNTEILFALGLESRVVGVTRYCNHPASARGKQKVGDRTTSVEVVLSLRPDLVLAHGFVNSQAIRDLEKHGIRVAAIDPKTLDQVEKDIRLVGRITNRERQAAEVAGRISRAKSLVKQKVGRVKTSPKVLVAVQANPLWAAGPETFVDEMIRLAGGENLASDARAGFNQYSAEAAIWRNPDVIIGTARGDARVLSRGIWKGTKAERSGRVHEADADLLVRAGPRLADGILAIAKLIHPDVFKDD